MNIIISNSSELPIYLQIVNQIKEAILSNNLKENEQLPSIRALAKDLNISLDLIQIHILEVKRFIEIIKNSTKEELKKNRLLSWMKFFTSDNLELIEDELKEENQIMSKVIEEYKKFTSDDKMMRAYAAREAFLVGQKMMLRREREDGFDEGIKR